jgi:hypothetical protein
MIEKIINYDSPQEILKNLIKSYSVIFWKNRQILNVLIFYNR